MSDIFERIYNLAPLKPKEELREWREKLEAGQLHRGTPVRVVRKLERAKMLSGSTWTGWKSVMDDTVGHIGYIQRSRFGLADVVFTSGELDGLEFRYPSVCLEPAIPF